MTVEKYRHPINPKTVRIETGTGFMIADCRDQFDGRVALFKSNRPNLQLARETAQIYSRGNFTLVAGPAIDTDSLKNQQDLRFATMGVGVWQVTESRRTSGRNK